MEEPNTRRSYSRGSSESRSNEQSRAWIGTINNPEYRLEDCRDKIMGADKNAKFTMQFERGETGTRYIQLFVQFERRRRLDYVRRTVDERGHYERARDARASERYCRKEQSRESGPITNIQDPNSIGQGARSEIAAACKDILGGTKLNVIAREYPSSLVRYYRGFGALAERIQSGRDWKSFVFWMNGPSGCGKARTARELGAQMVSTGWTTYEKTGSSRWWDGYEGNEIVVWDELCRDYPIEHLLLVLDRYSCKLETKGGHVNFIPRLIIITTNQSPHATYHNISEEHLKALMRRLNGVLELTGDMY